MTKAEAIDALDNLLGMIDDNHDTDYDEAIKMAIDALKQPERKKERWEMKWHVLFKQDVPCCSVCHNFTALKTPYCGLCGADMRGEDDD